jgi:hypothetical protein
MSKQSKKKKKGDKKPWPCLANPLMMNNQPNKPEQRQEVVDALSQVNYDQDCGF